MWCRSVLPWKSWSVPLPLTPWRMPPIKGEPEHEGSCHGVGGKVEIHDCIGYLPRTRTVRLHRLYRDNMMAYEHAGEDAFVEDWGDSRLHGPRGDISRSCPVCISGQAA